jgi:hypothetical protein
VVTFGNTRAMADRVGLTARRVKQLETEEAVFVRGPNGTFDLEWNAGRYRTYIEKDIDSVCHEIERCARDIDAGLDRLRTASPTQRTKLYPTVGPLIGRFHAALRLGAAIIASPGQRRLLAQHTDMITGLLVGEFLDLAGLTIQDGAAP